MRASAIEGQAVSADLHHYPIRRRWPSQNRQGQAVSQNAPAAWCVFPRSTRAPVNAIRPYDHVLKRRNVSFSAGPRDGAKLKPVSAQSNRLRGRAKPRRRLTWAGLKRKAVCRHLFPISRFSPLLAQTVRHSYILLHQRRPQSRSRHKPPVLSSTRIANTLQSHSDISPPVYLMCPFNIASLHVSFLINSFLTLT